MLLFQWFVNNNGVTAREATVQSKKRKAWRLMRFRTQYEIKPLSNLHLGWEVSRLQNYWHTGG